MDDMKEAVKHTSTTVHKEIKANTDSASYHRFAEGESPEPPFLWMRMENWKTSMRMVLPTMNYSALFHKAIAYFVLSVYTIVSR